MPIGQCAHWPVCPLQRCGAQEYISDLARNSIKFLVFAYHLDVIRALEEHLVRLRTGYMTILGETPAQERANNVRMFQERDDVQCVALLLPFVHFLLPKNAVFGTRH
jgi:hypothetical protein